MKQQNHSFFRNTECEYFPCHAMTGDFNCLFCYCPLYALGEACGGNFKYTSEGVKDCSDCLIPHQDGGYAYVQKKLEETRKRT